MAQNTPSNAGTSQTSAPINALGLDLLSKATDPKANALLSPYSIQMALSMAYAGADGETRAQMAKVLHYPADETQWHQALSALQRELERVASVSADRAKRMQSAGDRAGDPLTLRVANRLFGQEGYAFREPFLNLVKDTYQAPFQALDFVHQADAATRLINDWVSGQTRDRIQNLIPPGNLNRDTRLVLVNAIYLKAPWTMPFAASSTKPEAFHVNGTESVDVPTMKHQDRYGFAQKDGYSALVIPYAGGDLQLLVLLPEKNDGLPSLEKSLTPEMLASCASLPHVEAIIHLPKFKMVPPLLKLSRALEDLGMKSAFDIPQGSANFDRMAPRKPDDYLLISEVFHKTFLNLDEKGTEAAAATAVAMMRATSMPMNPPKPVEVRVDHPFLFAIQHRQSGTCLFLGRMLDPR